ncbi:MAG: RNA-guided endonuclease IscB [Bacillota bacterium]
MSLGVDAGSKTIGLSATTERDVLFEGEVQLRTDLVDLLSTRREFRRARRNRKTRYRQARFLNRKKPDGWLAPSVENKIQAHHKAVKLVYSILPVSKTVVEVAQFDIQKIKNPDIEDEEYQQGDQLGFWNVREYVFWRDNHTCQHCHGKSKDPRLNVHHIESRKTGGNAPNNLITLCETCHQLHHQNVIKLKVKRGASFRDAAFMGIMRWEFYNRLKAEYPNVSLTYGYLTKNARIRAGLEKSHLVDARCISENPLAQAGNTWYLIKQVRGQNRQLHKATIRRGGLRQENKAPKYVRGFRLFGRRSSGYFDLRLLDGSRVHASASTKKLRLLERSKTLLIERRTGDFLPSLKRGVSIA